MVIDCELRVPKPQSFLFDLCCNLILTKWAIGTFSARGNAVLSFVTRLKFAIPSLSTTFKWS